jgi:hypothetical protein
LRRLATLTVAENIGEVIMNKKVAEKRQARRKDENISEQSLGLKREKTVIDVKITAEDTNKYMQKIKSDWENNQRKSIADRQTQQDKIRERLSQVKERKFNEQQQEVTSILQTMDREKTIILNR